MWTALALILGVLPQTPIAQDRVAVIELNHVYDFEGKYVLGQFVFYGWRGEELHVRAWRLLKDHEQTRPRRDFVRGDWVLLWTDGNVLREVRAASYRESWTQHDRERTERDRLPMEDRHALLCLP